MTDASDLRDESCRLRDRSGDDPMPNRWRLSGEGRVGDDIGEGTWCVGVVWC
jgi:hypothetical protein